MRIPLTIKKLAIFMILMLFCATQGYAQKRGTLNASPAHCYIISGKSTCTITLSWNTKKITHTTLRVLKSGKWIKLSSAKSGKMKINWINKTGYRFELRGGRNSDKFLAAVYAKGYVKSGKLSASNTSCLIRAGANSCSTTLNWSTKHTSKATVWAFHKGRWVALRRGLSGSFNFSSILPGNNYFELHSGTVRKVPFARINVVGKKQSGIISSSQKSCDILKGEDSCSLALNWSTVNTRTAKIWQYKSGSWIAIANGIRGSLSIAVGEGNNLYELHSGSVRRTPLSSISIEGKKVEGSGALIATPSICELQDGNSTCSVDITWSTINVRRAKVWASINNKWIEVASGQSGEISIPWIDDHGYKFELHSGNKISGDALDAIFVEGEPEKKETALSNMKVFEGQYVIEEKNLNSDEGLNFRRKRFASNGFNLVKALGSNNSLVTREGFTYRSQQQQVVELDMYDTFCSEIISAGIATTCSPNFVIELMNTPNDTDYNDLWGMTDEYGISAESAWDITQGSKNTVVAVIDTGVDYNHPDLKDNLWINQDEIAGNGIDDDGNGYIDDIHGISGVDGSGDPNDYYGHGTHVAGTIGAKGNNARGVTGVNWKTQIMALKYAEGRTGSLDAAVQVINYMISMKKRGVNVRVANASWGAPGIIPVIESVVGKSIDAGILFVAAAGNNGSNNDENPYSPASLGYKGVVAVANSTKNQEIANSSNYGLFSVDLSAPGTDILSTIPGGGYQSYTGTSMAAPHVAGALTLLASREPSLNVEQLVDRVFFSATSFPKGVGKTYTGRKLNVDNLLRNQGTTVTRPILCAYTQKNIAYTPDRSADFEPIVFQGDNGGVSISLPFSFPFYRRTFTDISVSANGVIYMGNVQVPFDYDNSENAPEDSIAVLQTNLFSQENPLWTEENPYGIRYKVDNDSITIYWLKKYYAKTSLGNIVARATLKSTGEVDIFVETLDNTVLDILRDNSTIGVASGEPGDEPLTYVFNSNSLENRNSVRFSHACEESEEEKKDDNDEKSHASIHNITGHYLNKKQKSISKAKPDKTFFIEYTGRAVGSNPYASMYFKVDKKHCKTEFKVPFQYQSGGSISFIIPQHLEKHSKLVVTSGSAKEKFRIKRGRDKKQAALELKLDKQKYKASMKKACRQLKNSINPSS